MFWARNRVCKHFLTGLLIVLSTSIAQAQTVDHPTDTETRIRYTLEGIAFEGNDRTSSRVLQHYVRFQPGDVLDIEDPEVELTRYRLLGTGFFSSVEISLRKGSTRGTAILVVHVVERNTFIVQNVWLGIAADEDTAGNAKPISPFVGVQVAETNLAGTGVLLGAGVGIADNQFALRTTFSDAALAGTDWSARATLLYSDARDFFGSRDVLFESPYLQQQSVTDYAVVAYKRFGGTLGLGRDLGLPFNYEGQYHLEQIDAIVPIVASHVRGGEREPIDFDIIQGKSVLSTFRTVLTYDTRDAPFLTKRGTLATASATIGMAPIGSDYNFQKVEASARQWWRLPWRHVLKLEGVVGAIAGDAPFFEKFYVGDFTDLLPDRLLELAPDRRQPPNFFNTDIVEVRYGDYAAKIESEYRVPIYTGRGSIFGIDLFGAAGIYGVATKREFTDPPVSYSGFATLPIDFTYNLGLRVDTQYGGATIAFSNLISLIPVRSGDSR